MNITGDDVLYDLCFLEKLQEMMFYMTFTPRKITVVFVLYDLCSHEKNTGDDVLYKLYKSLK